MHLRPKNRHIYSFLFVFLMILIIPSISPAQYIQNFNISLDNINSDTLIENNPHAQSYNQTPINTTYTGSGVPLDYYLNITGTGGDKTYLNTTQYFIGGTNQTSDSIFLPNASLVNSLNLSITDLEINQQNTHVINDTVEYNATYSIVYTSFVNTADNDTAQINITIFDDYGPEIGNITVDINGIYNQALNATQGNFRNCTLNLTQNGFYDISFNFFNTSGDYFAQEEFKIILQEFISLINTQIQPAPQILNPYLTLNNTLTTNDTKAFRFQVEQQTQMTSLQIFATYNFFDRHADHFLNISIHNDFGGAPSNMSLNSTQFHGNQGEVNFIPNWKHISFPETTLNASTNYWIVFDAEHIGNGTDPSVYLNLYTTNKYNDTNQNSKYLNNSNWENMNPKSSILLQIMEDTYIEATLKDVTINVTMVDENNNPSTQLFNSTTNTTEFSIVLNNGTQWGNQITQSLFLQFQTNTTCQFTYNYSFSLTQERQTLPTTLTAGFNQTFTLWETWINATMPFIEDDVENKTTLDANSMTYAVYFPSNWYDLQGVTPTNNITTHPDTRLIINSSVSHLNWTFTAKSDYISGNITTTPENRNEFSPNMNITCEFHAPHNITQYDVSLSFWNATFTNNQSESIGFNVSEAASMQFQEDKSRTIFNQSTSTLFSTLTVPANYSNPILTVKFSWHNTTTAGIFLHKFIIKQNATLNATLNQVGSSDNIYCNDTLDLYFAWYSGSGERISYAENDEGRQFQIYFDGIHEINSIPGATEYIYNHEAISPEENIHISIDTRYIPWDNHVGYHNVSLFLGFSNNTAEYNNVSSYISFRILEIPSYLAVNSSSAFYFNTTNNQIYELITDSEELRNPLSLNIRLEYNATYSQNTSEISPFNWGYVGGYIRNINTGTNITGVLQFNSIYDGTSSTSGIYQGTFSKSIIQSLDPASNYEIIIFTNTTNIEEQSTSIFLKILPKQQLRLEIINIGELETVQESDIITIQGKITSNKGVYQNLFLQKEDLKKEILIIIEAKNDDTGEFEYIKTDLIEVNENGQFSYELEIPSKTTYSQLKITLLLNESRTYYESETDVNINIELNYINRILIPIGIFLIILLVVIPISKKYAPQLTFHKRKKKASTSTDLPQDETQIFRIPPSGSEINIRSNNPSIEKIEITPENINRSENPSLSQTVIDKIDQATTRFEELMKLFSFNQSKKEILQEKIKRYNDAVFLEQKGHIKEALINYYFAQEYTRVLELEAEEYDIENTIKRLQTKLPEKGKIKFMKKYKSIGDRTLEHENTIIKKAKKSKPIVYLKKAKKLSLK